jgi:hypothetical protein
MMASGILFNRSRSDIEEKEFNTEGTVQQGCNPKHFSASSVPLKP